MGQQTVDAFRAKLKSEPITLSRYEDSAGFWAKDITLCDRIRIEFASGVVFLMPDDLGLLTREERAKIDIAPSSSGV
jgi:hypothetical protein